MQSLSKQEVRYKVYDPKAYSKGGTLENTINGARAAAPAVAAADEDTAGAPQLIHANKVKNIYLSVLRNLSDLVMQSEFPLTHLCECCNVHESEMVFFRNLVFVKNITFFVILNVTFF